jgi:hypothetical protein
MFPMLRNAILNVIQILILAFLLAVLEKRAFAYADPGSGLVIVQFLSSVGVGAIFFLRFKLTKWVKAVFQKKHPSSRSEEHGQQT